MLGILKVLLTSVLLLATVEAKLDAWLRLGMCQVPVLYPDGAETTPTGVITQNMCFKRLTLPQDWTLLTRSFPVKHLTPDLLPRQYPELFSSGSGAIGVYL